MEQRPVLVVRHEHHLDEDDVDRLFGQQRPSPAQYLQLRALHVQLPQPDRELIGQSDVVQGETRLGAQVAQEALLGR